MAHELGHALLHKGVNTPFLRNVTTGTFIPRIEKEANQFAFKLLLNNFANDEAMTKYQIPDTLSLPDEMERFIKKQKEISMIFKTKMLTIIFLSIVILSACTNINLSKYDSENPMVISHRGSPVDYPEHSFAGYDDAINKGSRYIEQDLILSKDNKLVVSHDNNLKRTLGIDINISDTNYNELKKYKFKNGEHLHLLNDVFKKYGNDVNYVIETKQSGNKNHLMENELLNVVNGYNLENNIILQSFSLESLNYMNKKDNTIPQMLLLDDKKSENINTIIDTIPTNVKIITLSGNKMNKKTVDVIKKTDRLAMAYTLNTKTQIEKARQLKLDGFFTNETERALENKK